MGSLVVIGLANALFAGMLALAALLAGRYSRRPALVHGLWLLVLLKLVTPPLWIHVPWLDTEQSRHSEINDSGSPAPEPVQREFAMAAAEQPPPPAPAAETPPAMRIEELSKGGPDMPPRPEMPMPVMPLPEMPANGKGDAEVGGQKSEVRSQKSEVKSQPAATAAGNPKEQAEEVSRL